MRTPWTKRVMFLGVTAPFVAGMSPPGQPAIQRGQPISEIRAQLIKDGWTPVRIDQKTGGERENLMASARIFFEAGYFEVETCTGTGLNRCIFNYQKNGQCLRIVTHGERNPTVDDWTDACPE